MASEGLNTTNSTFTTPKTVIHKSLSVEAGYNLIKVIPCFKDIHPVLTIICSTGLKFWAKWSLTKETVGLYNRNNGLIQGMWSAQRKQQFGLWYWYITLTYDSMRADVRIWGCSLPALGSTLPWRKCRKKKIQIYPFLSSFSTGKTSPLVLLSKRTNKGMSTVRIFSSEGK